VNSTEIEKLWEEYSKTQSREIRDKIIVQYTPLVKIVAGRLCVYLGSTVEYEELVSYGIFGLIDAVDKFDYLKGIKFETYASLRIRGSILDQIRKLDWVPRTLRQKQKKIDTAVSALEVKFGRMPTNMELSEELQITEEELLTWMGQTNITNVISLDEFVDASGEKDLNTVKKSAFETPEEVVEKSETKKMLLEALETLTEKEKRVITLYYYEELTLKEISVVLEVSESRVSQLHTRALQKMKLKLGNQVVSIFTIY
jgi:RNA polymerase sigma factor for flagellar operon FliA